MWILSSKRQQLHVHIATSLFAYGRPWHGQRKKALQKRCNCMQSTRAWRHALGQSQMPLAFESLHISQASQAGIGRSVNESSSSQSKVPPSLIDACGHSTELARGTSRSTLSLQKYCATKYAACGALLEPSLEQWSVRAAQRSQGSSAVSNAQKTSSSSGRLSEPYSSVRKCLVL